MSLLVIEIDVEIAVFALQIGNHQFISECDDESSIFRILKVSNAEYADCNGLYTISNLTSVWDSKRIVYERIAGGLSYHERR